MAWKMGWELAGVCGQPKASCKQYLDSGLFCYFLRSRLWEAFAVRFMKPEQRDAVDLDALEALLPKP